MELHLKDKTVLITGGSRGIGRAIAEEFLNEGAKVFISSRHQEEVDKTIQDLSSKGNIHGMATDISDTKQIKSMMQKAVSDLGLLDILINNAGVFIQDDLLNATEENWDKTFAINVKGYFFCAQEAAKLIENTGGAIVNIASIAAVNGSQMAIAYSASKAAIVNLTKSLALSLAPKIRVNAIGPGLIDTAMVKDFMNNEQMMQFVLNKTPLKKAGRPEEISKMAVFLASDAASYMTGATVFIDGGWLAG